MGRSINVLDFDGVYRTQDFYRGSKVHWVNLTDLQNVSRCCEWASFQVISRRLAGARHHVTFIGSGNYHYVTLIFLRRVQVPFTLVLFDNHTDMFVPARDGLITCGSWVSHALKTLPLLQRVILVGTRKALAAEIPPFLRKKVVVFSQEQLKECSWLKYTIVYAIPTQTVYISIDKDVLQDTEVVTNWDQGSMSLAELVGMLHHLSQVRKVWGMDVCGEYEVNPLLLLDPKLQAWAAKNSRVNKALLTAAVKWAEHAS